MAQPRRSGCLHTGRSSTSSGSERAPGRSHDVKGDLEALAGPALKVEPAAHPALHPGRSARVLIGDAVAGWLGELHPALVQDLELPLPPIVAEIDLEPLLERSVPVYEEVSKFPPVIRDLSIVIESERSAAEVLAEIALAVADEPAGPGR